MGQAQSEFLSQFKSAFCKRYGETTEWFGGQRAGNRAALPISEIVRRPGITRSGESFELADLAVTLGKWRVVIEFESGAALPLSNLLKFWPYVRGELNVQPTHDMILVHFSDWSSYATRRELWQWTFERMQEDSKRRVAIEGRQFDHWGADEIKRQASIDAAIEWILVKTGHTPSLRTC